MTKGDVHALDDLGDFISVVALGPSLLLYSGRVHPYPADHRSGRPRDSAHARPDSAGVEVRKTRSVERWRSYRFRSNGPLRAQRTRGSSTCLSTLPRLEYPGSPHAPERLWEWEKEHRARLL